MAHETVAFAFELLTKTAPLLLFDPAVSLFKRLPELDQHYVFEIEKLSTFGDTRCVLSFFLFFELFPSWVLRF